MPSDGALAEPWRSFLKDIDDAAGTTLTLWCIGGFAVSLFYGLSRPTGDIDVVDVAPSEAKAWLAALAGPGSALHRRHKIYLQIVTVAVLPYHYEERSREVFAGQFERIRLRVPEPYDLVLSKLTRDLAVDLEDAKHLARTAALDLRVLEQRYQEELRPYVTGPPEKHDVTLRLWIDAIGEERSETEHGC
jgi:Nucleotidyltransferase of unknown function (DUF6036)